MSQAKHIACFSFFLYECRTHNVAADTERRADQTCVHPQFPDAGLRVAFGVLRGFVFIVNACACVLLDSYPLARRAKLPLLCCTFANLLRVWIKTQFVSVHEVWFQPKAFSVLGVYTSDTQTIATTALANLLLFFANYSTSLWANAQACVLLTAAVDVHAPVAPGHSEAAAHENDA